ncbi:MAG: IMP dehydrogenase [Bacteroidia bacterium]
MFENKILYQGLTYDDVLLIPNYSEILPREVNVSTFLTHEIRLNVPIVSAAMDTVTEHDLAIAMAAEGGLGFIHKNMSIEKQAEEVRKVKRSESGMIVDPITVQPEATLREIVKLMKEQGIGGIPITDKTGKLVGIITNRDLRFQAADNRTAKELMTSENLITAPAGVTMEEAENILRAHKIEKLPIVDAHYRLVGLITYRDIIKKRNFPNACKDHLGRLRTGAAVGVTPEIYDRIEALMKAGVDVIGIDTAHGHSKGVLDVVRNVRQKWGDLQIVAGNVATAEGAKALMEAGANGIKVGVGPGSICTTRVIAGVGVPQLSAVMEAYKGVEGKVPIIADGGIKFSGDMVKALAAGANVVMVGGLLAGTDESPGETILYEGRKFKSYRGMGSIEAMKQGSKDRYFQDAEDDVQKLVPEGIEGRVPYKGKVSEVIYQQVGGIKAGMGYCGAGDLDALKACPFVQITNAGLIESHPHDVQIMKEAPNYHK